MISTARQDKSTAAPTVERGGPATIAGFGDFRAEFQELLTGCGVYGLEGRAKAAITGSDRVRWLNGIVTNNIRDLSTGHGAYAFLLNPQGRILGDLYAFARADSLTIDTDASQFQKILGLFDRYIIMDDVEVGDMSAKFNAIGITGPKAREVLRRAGVDFPDLQPLQFVDLSWKGIPLTVIRRDSPVIESYEIWTSPENAASLLENLANSGARPVGATALNYLRIAEGIPLYGQDIRERDLPQETEQQRALHFTKGCYIGQEIVERIRSRGNVHRKFTGFTVEGVLPAPGTKIQVDGKEVGEITSAAAVPLIVSMEGRASTRDMTGETPVSPSINSSYPVALGYIRREVGTPGRQIQLDDSRLTVTNLPFTDVFKH